MGQVIIEPGLHVAMCASLGSTHHT
jgi:hypothetical protein